MASLTGERDLLTEIARGALAAAVDDLTDALHSLREGRVEVDGLARELRRVAGLFELVQTVHAAPT